MMKNEVSPSKELDASTFGNTDILFTTNLEVLKDALFHVVAVPTDIGEHKVPNLTPLKKASETAGKAVKSRESKTLSLKANRKR